MAHSKRNSTSAFFTQSERAELRSTWGSRATRLTRESFLPFGSCNLCLLHAREPVSCQEQGHIFCRECAIANLLAQSKEIKRLKKDAERRKADAELQSSLEDSEKQAKDLQDFVSLQNGLKSSTQDNQRKRKLEGSDSDSSRDPKRHTYDSTSFWVPSQRPSEKEKDIKVTKEHSSCPVATDQRSHDLSLKTMVAVNFSEAASKDDAKQKANICPSCSKPLSNTTKGVLAKPCGHVLCKSCSDQFQKLPEQTAHDPDQDLSIRCYVCQSDLTPSKASEHDGDYEKEKKKKHRLQRGLVELRSEGTGFAGGGNNMVKRDGLAFQVG